MRLIRFGPPGHETPGVLLADGTRIDVSEFTRDYDEEFFARGGVRELSAWLRGAGRDAPRADPGERLGSPVARPSKIVCIGLNYRHTRHGARRPCHLSRFMTLLPGDVISTGTPAGVGMGMKPDPRYLQAGDLVEASIDGLGTRRQRIVAAAQP